MEHANDEIGHTYLERGKPVVVLIQWGAGGGPRNVLVKRADESLVVRPSRGLAFASSAVGPSAAKVAAEPAHRRVDAAQVDYRHAATSEQLPPAAAGAPAAEW